MARPVSIDFSKSEDSGFYVPPGRYAVQCSSVAQKDGNEYPYLEFNFTVVGEGVTLKHRCSFAPSALFNLRNTLHALLGTEIPKSTVRVDLDKLVNRTAVATVADREYDGKTYANIIRLDPPDKSSKLVAASKEDDLSDL